MKTEKRKMETSFITWCQDHQHACQPGDRVFLLMQDGVIT